MHLIVEALGNRDYGGATVFLDFLAAAAAESAFSTITVLTAPSDKRSYSLPDSPKLRDHPLPLADKSVAYRAYWLSRRFDRFVQRLGADVVISLNGMGVVKSRPSTVLIQQSMPFYPEAAAKFGYRMRFRFNVILRLMSKACRSANLVYVQTETMQRRVIEEFHLDMSVTSVHTPDVAIGDNYPESKAVSAIMSRAPSDRRLLYVGSDSPHKNLPLLAGGIGLIRAEMADATLFLTLPQDHPICATDGVECLGVLSPSDVHTACRLATVLCQPSLTETVGLPMLEAMSAGLPVIAADRSYVRDICRDAALRFDPHDVTSFVRAAIKLLSDESLRDIQIQRGLNVVAENRHSDPYREMARSLAELGRGRMQDNFSESP